MKADVAAEGAAPLGPWDAVLGGLARGQSQLNAGYSADRAGDAETARAHFEQALSAFREALADDQNVFPAHLGMAWALFALGRFDQARSRFERAIVADDRNPEAQWGAAAALISMGRLDDAVPKLRGVTELAPQFEEAWSWLGRILAEGRQHKEALKVFDRATEEHPHNPEFWLSLGEQLRDIGQLDAALDPFDRAVAEAQQLGQVPQEFRGRLLAGGVLLELGRAGPALEQFEAMLSLGKRLAAAAAAGSAEDGTANMKSERVDVSAAESDIASVMAYVHYGAGWSNVALKRYDAAIEHFEAARDTHDQMALLGLWSEVVVMRALGRYRGAWTLMAELRSANELSLAAGKKKTDTDYATAYGEALRLLGDRTEAAELYLEAIEIDPVDKALRGGLIATYMECRDQSDPFPFSALGNWAKDADYSESYEGRPKWLDEPASRAAWFGKARDDFARTEALVTDDMEAYRTPQNLVALGGLLVLMERPEKAKRYLLEAVRKGQDKRFADTHVESAHAQLGLAYAQTHDHVRAARHFDAAARYDPDDLNYQIGLAEAHLRMGHPEAALERYQMVINVAPGNVEAHVGLAEALTAQGDAGNPECYERAEREFSEAIRLARTMDRPYPALRESSTSLSQRKLSTVHYSRGYALVRLHEAETAKGPLRRGAAKHLTNALKAFQEAQRADRHDSRAPAAIERVQREQRQRSREQLHTWVPLALAGICFALLVAVHLFVLFAPVRNMLDKNFRDALQPDTYAMLVFGLLLFLLAAVSLPQLLKLKVAGIALEKTAVEQATPPAQLDIERERLASLIPARVLASAGTESRPALVAETSSMQSDGFGPGPGERRQGARDAEQAQRPEQQPIAQRAAEEHRWQAASNDRQKQQVEVDEAPIANGPHPSAGNGSATGSSK